jgi:hypothetical protein
LVHLTAKQIRIQTFRELSLFDTRGNWPAECRTKNAQKWSGDQRCNTTQAKKKTAQTWKCYLCEPIF